MTHRTGTDSVAEKLPQQHQQYHQAQAKLARLALGRRDNLHLHGKQCTSSQNPAARKLGSTSKCQVQNQVACRPAAVYRYVKSRPLALLRSQISNLHTGFALQTIHTHPYARQIWSRSINATAHNKAVAGNRMTPTEQDSSPPAGTGAGGTNYVQDAAYDSGTAVRGYMSTQQPLSSGEGYMSAPTGGGPGYGIHDEAPAHNTGYGATGAGTGTSGYRHGQGGYPARSRTSNPLCPDQELTLILIHHMCLASKIQTQRQVQGEAGHVQPNSDARQTVSKACIAYVQPGSCQSCLACITLPHIPTISNMSEGVTAYHTYCL